MQRCVCSFFQKHERFVFGLKDLLTEAKKETKRDVSEGQMALGVAKLLEPHFSQHFVCLECIQECAFLYTRKA